MIKSYFFLVSLFFLCCGIQTIDAAQRNNKKTESTKENVVPYSFIIPKGWECLTDSKQLPEKVRVVFIGSGKHHFTPSINLASEKTPLELDEYISLAKSYHESQGETRCSLLGSIETRSGTAKLLQIDRKTQWGPVRFLQAALIQDETAYVITATCLQEEFQNLSNAFLTAIQSFKNPEKIELCAN